MSESKSLADLDDFDRALLGSARADHPDKGAALRAAAVLGVGLSAAPSVAVASASGTAARILSLSGYKWTLIGAIGVAGAGTGTVAYLGSTEQGGHRGSAAAAVVGEPRAHDRPAATERAVRPADNVPPPPEQGAEPDGPGAAKSPAPATVPDPRGVGPAVTGASKLAPTEAEKPRPAAPVTKAPANGVSIAEEVAIVDRARHALRQGRAGEAFDELNRYQERWPNGVLATEVVVLRVEAQLRLGRRDAAKRDAQAFIQTQPSSRYAARLRELFESGELD